MKTKSSRRDFIKTSVGVGALLGFPTIIPSSVLGKDGAVAPSNRINIGVIGCGSQSGKARSYVQYEKSQIVAVCDPIKEHRQKTGGWFNISETNQYNDYRDLLAREDIDGVHISTSDHWHVPISLAAARAGKDAFCQKPLGVSIEQNLAARKIVRKYDRVFQYGVQQRSTAVCRMGIELVLNGHIGDVQAVYVWAPRGRSGGVDNPEVAIPEGFDYDLWQGPAPMRPFTHDRCLRRKPKSIFFNYDYAIGFIAGWGAHPMDQLQWWADEKNMGIPIEYKTSGTIPTEGLYNTATHWDMESVYANGVKLHFMDNETAKAPSSRVPAEIKAAVKQGDATVFMGTKGWIAVSRGVLKTSSDDIRRQAKDPGPIRLPVSAEHQYNFVDSIISREQPVANLESACLSDNICQIGDIGIRTGETLKWDPVQETLVGSEAAVKMMSRPMRAPYDDLS